MQLDENTFMTANDEARLGGTSIGDERRCRREEKRVEERMVQLPRRSHRRSDAIRYW